MSAPVVEFRTAAMAFASSDGSTVQALREVSFAIDRHEFVALIGPSGCGKSTLLRLAAGLLLPTEGEVRVHGMAVTGPRDEIGIVFQRPTLLPWLNVVDNVAFPERLKTGRVDPRTRRRAEELVATVGLERFARKRPEELSGGMQQRVGIARALLQDPDILLMDEPFSALDALTRDEMSLELLRILRDKPKTVMFVTHSIPEAMLLSDRIVVLGAHPGHRIETMDVPFARPRSLETLVHPDFNRRANDIRERVFGRRREELFA